MAFFKSMFSFIEYQIVLLMVMLFLQENEIHFLVKTDASVRYMV